MNQYEFLQASVLHDRLAHAYILSGNDILNKEKTVLQFSQYLNCEQENRPCTICQSCKWINKGVHPDVIRLSPSISSRSEKKEFNISQVRELHRRVNLGGWNSKYTIIVLGDVHTMNHEAQSAFLKILEEPKGSTIFILLAQHADAMLDTIRSRAQILPFFTAVIQDRDPNTESDTTNKLIDGSLYERFEEIKRISEQPSLQIEKILSSLLVDMRGMLLKHLHDNDKEVILKDYTNIKRILNTYNAITKTNTNVRLALEQVAIHA